MGLWAEHLILAFSYITVQTMLADESGRLFPVGWGNTKYQFRDRKV